MITRRMCEKVRYFPAYRDKRWDQIPRDILFEMVLDSVAANSHWEVTWLRTLREQERLMIESGDWVRHPQLGLITRRVADDLIRWAEEGEQGCSEDGSDASGSA